MLRPIVSRPVWTEQGRVAIMFKRYRVRILVRTLAIVTEFFVVLLSPSEYGVQVWTRP
jgi:hypothetical protein